MASEFGIQQFAANKEYSPEEIKASSYYLTVVDGLGGQLGAHGWSKNLRARTSAFVRHPNAAMLQQLSSGLAEAAIQPSETQLSTIRNVSSSIADRINPTITLSLVYGRALDEIKISTIGQKTPTTGINALMGIMFAEIMWRSESISEADLQDAIRVAEAASKLGEVGLHWYIPKIMHLYQAGKSKQKASEYLRGVKTDGEKSSVAELAAANDELFEDIRRLRKYGLKPCIAPGLSQGEVREWLVREMIDDATQTVPAFHPASSALAEFIGSAKKIESTEATHVDYVSRFDDGQTVKVGGRHTTGLDFDARVCDLTIGPDGHIQYLAGQRWVDYFDPALRTQYEQIRSEVLSIFFDAVVPVYITEQVKKELGNEPKRILGRLGLGKKTDLRRLVLARTRVIRENLDEVEKELANPSADLAESDEKKRKIAKHDVEWHIRQLPAGYKASPEQRELCLKRTGIVLAETGETYVKKHTRGTEENKSKGHRVSFLAGKMATKRAQKKK